MKTRNQNVEFLRILMMLMIVIMHISARLFDLDKVFGTPSLLNATILGIRGVSFLGVSTFALITGYYGARLNYKKLFDIEFMALEYGIIVLIANFLFHSPLDREQIFGLLLPVSSGFLWYLQAYVLLVIITPIINLSLDSLSKRIHFSIMILLFLICYIGKFINLGDSCNFLTLFCIYIIGQYLYRYQTIFERKCVGLLVVFSSALFFLPFTLNIFNKGIFCKVLESNFNPLVLGASICLFFTFKNESIIHLWCKKNWYISRHMLAVYIIHGNILRTSMFNFEYFKGNLIFVFIIAIVILLISCIIDYTRVRLLGGIHDIITDKLYKVRFKYFDNIL